MAAMNGSERTHSHYAVSTKNVAPLHIYILFKP
jgi:hypothetical protein